MNEIQNSPLLEDAWNEQIISHKKVLRFWDEASGIKKRIEKLKKELSILKVKFQSIPPWKGKGLEQKRRNIWIEIERLTTQYNEIRK